MVSNLFFALVVLSLVGQEYYCDHPGDRTRVQSSDKKREVLEKQALVAYKIACHRLQELADWMSILLKMKTLWARSVSKEKRSRLHSSHDHPSIAEEFPTRHSRSDDKSEFLNAPPSCASLKNLQASAWTYVQWQAELVRTKAMMGGNFLLNSLPRFNETADVIKGFRDRILSLELANRTSSDLLDSLKLGGAGLSLRLQSERARTADLIRGVGQSNDFLGYLRATKDKLVGQVESLVETSEGLKKARDLMAKGELLQTLGSALDKRLMMALASPSTNGSSSEPHD